MRSLLAVPALLLVVVAARAQDGPLHQWQFVTDRFVQNAAKPTAGALAASVVGPVRFAPDAPHALLLAGDAKSKQRIDVMDDLAKAGLPTKALSVEAWVRIDKPARTGGIVSIVQGKGADAQGVLLGYADAQFAFAVAAQGTGKLATIKARATYQPGFWYHVVGVYDGAEMRLYVDGKLQAQSAQQSGAIVYPARGSYTLGAYRNDAEIVPLAGQLEQVSVFGRALTGDETATRFAARKKEFPETELVQAGVKDWPTYQRDARRTGLSDEPLPFPLKLRWVYRGRHAPAPSWPEEAQHDYWHNKYDLAERVTYDRAFHLVAVGDRVWFGSSADDKVYCLDASTGQERWTYFTEGPVRLAPTVADGRLLVGSDDGFLYCLNAQDGTLHWRSRLGPSGRRIPGNGRVISPWPVRTDAIIDGGRAYFCAGVFPSQGVFQGAVDLRDGGILANDTLAVTAQGYLERNAGKLAIATGRNPAGAMLTKLQRLGKEITKEISTLPADYPYAFIGAGDVRIGGGDGKIGAFRVSDGSKVWSAQVEGKVYSLAVARGRLLASTDKGHVYCFSADAGEPNIVTPPVTPVATEKHYADAADLIIQKAGVTRGYCLVLGSANGLLAAELAKRSQLHVIGREPNARQVKLSRQMLDAAGLYGRRVTIHRGGLDELPYTDYQFNLIVSEPLLGADKLAAPRAEIDRVLRPCGGVAVLGVNDRDVVRRGPLAGAGEWSHMYADAGNTACSNDLLVEGKLALQWFGAPGPRGMIDRHHRTVAPLYKHGRMFVPGDDRVVAVDAYNGTILWDQQFPGSRRVVVFRDCSYLLATEDHLWLASATECLALNPQTGARERTFAVPAGPKGEKQEWGYLGVVGDVLVGSAVKPGSSRRSQSRLIDTTETYYDEVPVVGSDALFGLDARSGKPLWTYQPVGLILNATIASAGRVGYFIESTNPATLQTKLGRGKLVDLLGKGSRLTALDLVTGKVIWRKEAPLQALQHNVYLAAAQDRVVIVGSRNSGRDKNKDTVRYDINVYDAATGEARWTLSQDTGFKIGGDHGEQDQHPVVVGAKLYCEPYAYDLHSGARLDWKWPWVGKKRSGCGNISASASSFFFRHDTASMFDLKLGQQKPVTTETRPGCWINLIPAGGLLLAPEASSGCTCNFAVQTSLALIPVKEKQ